MRIAIVAPERIPVPPLLGGSVEIVVLAIAKELAKQHSVTVISRSHRRYPSHSVESGVHIHRVPTGSPGQYLANVRRFLAGRKFDVIQIDNRPRFVAPIKRLFPHAAVSLFLHSLTYVSATGAGRAAVKRGILSADLIVVNSLSLHEEIKRRFPESAPKIHKVWLGVDTERFCPLNPPASGQSLTLLFAGRLIPRKGLPVLLKAVKLAQAHCSVPLNVIIAGGAQRKSYSNQMRKLARLLGVQTLFLGNVPHADIHRCFQSADVFVCPSQKHEAFGLVNVEALSSGLPVIASDIGGIREIVSHGQNGFLISAYSSPNAFADAIALLANRPELLRFMKMEARRDCLNRFSWTETARVLGQLYSPFEASDKNE